MFSKLSLFAAIAPLVTGLILEIPEKPTTGGQVTIKWTNEQGDPATWSFELINQQFNNAFAIANNVDPASNSITITLPVVPVGDGYTLEAVNIGNISDVFATTGDFAVGDTTSTSTTAASTTTTGTSTGTKTGTGVTQTTNAGSITPGFSSVISPANPTTPGSSVTSVTTGNSAASTTSNSAALSSRVAFVGSFGGFAAVLLSTVAGAAMLAL